MSAGAAHVDPTAWGAERRRTRHLNQYCISSSERKSVCAPAVALVAAAEEG